MEREFNDMKDVFIIRPLPESGEFIITIGNHLATEEKFKSRKATKKETTFVEKEKKPIIGTKEAQQQNAVVSFDIPIKPLPTEEERDKALDKAKAEIELVKITNNFGSKKEDGTDDIAKNITDYYKLHSLGENSGSNRGICKKRS